MRSVATSFAALIASRVELAVLELQEQVELHRRLLMLRIAAGACFAMAALVVTAFVELALWDVTRVAAAGAMAVVYLGGGLLALARMRRRMREAQPAFATTLAEIEDDLRALRRHDE